tara:strand:+ start:757 stop:966 length:210 start_codon:yes stop_codon:yes gene_type:complete
MLIPVTIAWILGLSILLNILFACMICFNCVSALHETATSTVSLQPESEAAVPLFVVAVAPDNGVSLIMM